MRHRVQNIASEWKRLGASKQVLGWIRQRARVPFIGGRQPPPFNYGTFMLDATKQQLDFMNSELPRFLQLGAWEPRQRNIWVSRMFLVPKPGENKWRLAINLRPMNKYYKDHKRTYETLKHLENLTGAGDWMVSFDFADGYYTRGIREEDKDVFTVNYRGTLYKLAGFSMGWKCRCYYFCRLTEVFIRRLREPLPNPPSSYELAAHAINTGPTLSAKLAMEGCPITPVHGRPFFLPSGETQLNSSATASRAYSTASG
jgi:hypothetical protein